MQYNQTVNGEALSSYYIIETPSCPMISDSRVSLFDVMEAHDAGDSICEIGQTFNLLPLQVQTALDYIAEHRARLEPELAAAIRVREARHPYYQEVAENLAEKIAQSPMTPQRAAFYALREKNRQKAEEQARAVYS